MGSSRRGNLAVAVLCAVVLVVPGVPASGAVAAAPTRGYVGHAGGHAGGNALGVFDPATNTVINRIPLDITTYSFEVRPDGREIYVADLHGGSVVVISTVTNAVVATIPAGGAAKDVSFSPDSRRAFVTNDRGVTVIDTTARRVVATIPLGDIALDSAASPDGARVYTITVSSSGANYSLRVISTATNQVTKNVRVRTGGVSPGAVIFSPNGRIAMWNTGEVFDTGNDTLSHTIAFRTVMDFEFTPAGDQVYIANLCFPNPAAGSIDLVDVASGRTVRTLSTGGNPWYLELTGDGTRLYARISGGITELEAPSGRVLDTFGVADTDGVGQIELSETAPAATAPGQRFAPRPAGPNPCVP